MEKYPKLVNPHDDSVISITNPSFSIGRSLSCDHIIQSLGVSRFHCIIKKNNNKWTLVDRSTNGTVVNSTLYKFNESVDLKSGDLVKLGPDNLDFVFMSDKSSHAEDVILVADPVIAEEFEHPFELEVTPTQAEVVEPAPDPTTEEKKDQPKAESQNGDIMENELTCSICSELFIKAVTLNCSHTYCKFCIDEWRKNKSNCPICRNYIQTVAPTLVLDNFIEKYISTQSDEVKDTRKALVQQRQDQIGKAAGSSTAAVDMNIIELDSDNDDQSDDADADSEVDYSDYSGDEDYSYYNYFDSPPRSRPGGPFYGGYGRCFICNQSGHWANGCPFKRH